MYIFVDYIFVCFTGTNRQWEVLKNPLTSSSANKLLKNYCIILKTVIYIIFKSCKGLLALTDVCRSILIPTEEDVMS